MLKSYHKYLLLLQRRTLFVKIKRKAILVKCKVTTPQDNYEVER